MSLGPILGTALIRRTGDILSVFYFSTILHTTMFLVVLFILPVSGLLPHFSFFSKPLPTSSLTSRRNLSPPKLDPSFDESRNEPRPRLSLATKLNELGKGRTKEKLLPRRVDGVGSVEYPES